MSTQGIYAAVAAVARRRLRPAHTGARVAHLDIGAGWGDLISEIGRTMPTQPRACDYHVERFLLDGVACDRVNLDKDPLPYRDAEFDLVTSSEVIEHLENFRALLRETFRVTAAGGIAIVTTPNVLSTKSRMQYLVSGFANLFGPLPIDNPDLGSLGGHISPIPYFYLAHALSVAGFEEVEMEIDKVQKSSVFWLVLLAPLIFAGAPLFLARERQRYRTLTAENEAFVMPHFSWRLLVGRTIVVSARRPAQAAA